MTVSNNEKFFLKGSIIVEKIYNPHVIFSEMIITIIDHMNSKRKAYNLGFKKKLSHNELNMTGKFLQRQFWKFEEMLYSYTSACVQTNSLKLVRLWFGFVSITGFLDILRCRYISINSVAIKFIHITCVIYHENNISAIPS